eukprot:6190493-Pleurochrysis_carterae.AAC.1
MRTMLVLLVARCAPERCADDGTLKFQKHAVQDDHPLLTDALQVFDGVEVVDGAASAPGVDADGADADRAVEAKDGREDGLVDGMED